MYGWGEFHKLFLLDRRLGLEILIYSRSEIFSNFRNTSHVSTWSKIVTVCTKCENKGFKKLVKLSISYVFQQSYHNFEVEICSWTNCENLDGCKMGFEKPVCRLVFRLRSTHVGKPNAHIFRNHIFRWKRASFSQTGEFSLESNIHALQVPVS